ncbi:MAG: helix-turn-helix transcriptional regulator [Clostridia bacterium]|nr:helix-turn-helix transcriptional regulator [Clostridia bacterium]
MLTQEQLAGLIGVTTSFVGHMEHGSRAVSVETLARLCKALEMDMHYIVFGDFSGYSVNPDLLHDLKELLKKY